MEREAEIATIKRLVGQSCVFKEKLLIRHVKVTDVAVDAWGARLDLQVLMTPGFQSGLFSKFDVSASWDNIGISDRSIGASYVSWLLVFRPDLVARITAFVIAPHTERDLMQYVNKVAYGTEPD